MAISFIGPAQAYIDGGSGMMIVQMLCVAAVTGWFIIKGYWHKMIQILRRIMPRNSKTRKAKKDTIK